MVKSAVFFFRFSCIPIACVQPVIIFPKYPGLLKVFASFEFARSSREQLIYEPYNSTYGLALNVVDSASEKSSPQRPALLSTSSLPWMSGLKR